MEMTEEQLIEMNKASDGDAVPEAAPVDHMDNKEVNKAALDYSNLVPQIRGRALTMKGKALGRVFAAVIEFPLSDKEVKFRSKEEHELFVMCLHAQSCKQVMMQAVFKNQQMLKEIENAAVDGIVEEALQAKGE